MFECRQKQKLKKFYSIFIETLAFKTSKKTKKNVYVDKHTDPQLSKQNLNFYEPCFICESVKYLKVLVSDIVSEDVW